MESRINNQKYLEKFSESLKKLIISSNMPIDDLPAKIGVKKEVLKNILNLKAEKLNIKDLCLIVDFFKTNLSKITQLF